MTPIAQGTAASSDSEEGSEDSDGSGTGEGSEGSKGGIGGRVVVVVIDDSVPGLVVHHSQLNPTPTRTKKAKPTKRNRVRILRLFYQTDSPLANDLTSPAPASKIAHKHYEKTPMGSNDFRYFQ